MMRLAVSLTVTLLLIPRLSAGELDPPEAPNPTMLTLEDLAASVGSAESSAQLGRTPITVVPGETLLIEEPGHHVLIGSVVTGTDAIQVSAEDVTLDLNGHTLQGPDTGIGILVRPGLQGVRVVNGTLRDFSFGINVSSAAAIMVESVELVSNDTGIVVFNSQLTAVRECTAVGNGTGIELIQADRTTIEENVVAFNLSGIEVDSTSTQTLVRANEIHGHTNTGSIGLENNSASSVILGNLAFDNDTNYGGSVGASLTVDGLALTPSTGPWANLDL